MEEKDFELLVDEFIIFECFLWDLRDVQYHHQFNFRLNTTTTSSNLVSNVFILCSGFLRLPSGQLILACGTFVHPSQVAGRRMINVSYSRGPSYKK